MSEHEHEELEEKECCCHDHEHEHHHHHHDDDDECCCHDHEHEHHHHHHDHDDDCDCGCHDHEHHHHDEGTSYDIPGYSVFETHSHEGATICSFEKEILADVPKAREAMEVSILEIRDWLNDTGALIGHVKGYIKEAGPTTTFSTTGAELNIEGHESAGASIGFASIVFGPSEEELKDKVVEIFARL